MKNIFEFRDSRSYLIEVLGGKSDRSGTKSRAAEATGCHTTVVSQILNGRVQLNLEQADRFNEFLGHNLDESHYFLLLVQKERAGTRSLEQYFLKQIEVLRESRLVIKKRIGNVPSVSKEDEQRYYSAWHYAAIHVALSVPTLRTAEALSLHFRLPLGTVNDTLAFLLESGLAIKTRGAIGITAKHVHLGSSSPHVTMHHRNWRLKAMENVDRGARGGLHYSSAVTVSRDDAVLIKGKIIDYLKELSQVITASPEEDVYALNFDFFPV